MPGLGAAQIEKEKSGVRSLSLSHYYEYGHNSIGYLPFMANAAFMAEYEHLKALSALPVESMWTVWCMARQALKAEGDYCECGVDRGGSASLIYGAMKDSGKHLHLYDTFAGMPKGDPELDWHVQGDFADTSLERVRVLLGEDRIHYHPGMLPDTFTEEDGPFAFIHLDLDLYASTDAALKHLYPRLSRGGIMVMDDYARHMCQGVRKAIDEFFAGRDNLLFIPISQQAVLFKT